MCFSTPAERADMTTTTQTVPRLLTAAEFEALGDIGRAELVRGKVVHLVRPKPKHGRVAQNITRRLDRHVEPRKLGQVYGSEIGYVVERDPDTVRAPDVSFVRAEVSAAHDESEWYPHGPDLAVEVVSPTETGPEVDAKVAMWLASGSRSVWVVDPQRRSGRIHRGAGADEQLAEDGFLQDQAVLPGFSMTLREALDGPEAPHT